MIHLPFLMNLLALTWLSLSLADAQTTPTQPNIVLVFIDDLGWAAITPYGNPYQQMPHLDRLAAEGMKFTQAYVTPQCTPTRASLLTGQHTARNEMWHVIPGYGYPYARMQEPVFRRNLPQNTYTLSKALQDNGYTTALLGKWHLTANDDGYYTYLFDHAKQHYGFDYVNPRQNPESYHARGDKGVAFLTQEAMGFMETATQAGKPFFVYLSHHTIHNEVLAPDSLVEKYKALGWPYQNRQVEKIGYPSNAVYLGALNHIDNSLGQLFSKIEELGIEENTIVIFLSDNGGVDNQFENFPLRYGKGSPFEGGIRVPFLVKWPGKVRPASVSQEPVHVVDMYPTLLEMAGATMHREHSLDGLSLLPLLTGQGKPNRDALYWYMPLYDIQWGATPSAIIREGSYKLIHFFGDYIDLENASAYIPEARTFLFDLEKDISETQNLSEARPELRDRLKVKLFQWLKEIGTELPTLNPNYQPDSVYVSKPGGRFKP
ncbi:MAG: sulfatase [Bacteroidia bacterium]|nr:sulfatase [Bacteroidia bacterium]